MTRPRTVALFAAALVLAGGAIWLAVARIDVPGEATIPQPTIALIAVPVYFVAPDGAGLYAETRSVARGADPTESARAVLRELLSGPKDPKLTSPIPTGTRLRAVYVDRRKHAYCDFTAELRDRHPGGTWAEQMTVYAIVNTLITAMPAIRKVQILVDGGPIDTLAGHLDTSRGLSRRLLLVHKLSGQ